MVFPTASLQKLMTVLVPLVTPVRHVQFVTVIQIRGEGAYH